MLQFQAVNPGSIRFLDIEIGKIVVEDIPNLDPKGLGIAKCAIVHRIHIQILKDPVAAVRMEDGIDPFKAPVDLFPIRIRVIDTNPERIFVIAVIDGYRTRKSEEVLIQDGDLYLSVILLQIGIQSL